MSAEARFEVFLAFPSIEIVFFQDRALFEHLVHRKLTDLEWHIAKFCPKEALAKILEGCSGGLTLEEILSHLTDEAVAVLQKHPFVRELSEFLSSGES